MNKNSKQLFQPVENPREVTRYIFEGMKSFSDTFLWTVDQQLQFNSRITLLNPDGSFYLSLPKEKDIDFTLLTNDKNRNCFFNLKLHRASLFFKTPFLLINDTGIKFKIPQKIFKVQRRAFERFRVPVTDPLYIEFRNPFTQGHSSVRKVIDIGAGGLTFFAPESEVSSYKPGLILENFQLTIVKTISTQVEIRYVNPLPQVRSLRVGVSFVDLKTVERDLIMNYVNHENRKYFSRLL